MTLNCSRYRPKDPATFAVGDIVEVQVSFAAFSTRGRNSNALELVLRGVTLLTDRFSRVRSSSLTILGWNTNVTRLRE